MVVNSSWGTKRSCPKCVAHFYDLNKNPATCPKCNYIYDATLVVRPRRGRSKKPVSVEMAEERMQAHQEIVAMNKKKKTATKIGKDDDSLDDFEEVEVEGGGDEIEEVEDEIETIDEVESDKSSNNDDADDESIMEELDDIDGAIVDSVEEESDDLDDDDESSSKKKTKKQSSKKTGRR